MKSNVITMNFTPDAVMSGTDVINSDPIRIDQIYGFSVQAVWTGTPVGDIKLQGSCDSPPKQTQVSNGGPDAVTNWTDIANSSFTTTGADGNYLWNINGAFYNYVRVTYTNASGTGSLSANICLKG